VHLPPQPAELRTSLYAIAHVGVPFVMPVHLPLPIDAHVTQAVLDEVTSRSARV